MSWANTISLGDLDVVQPGLDEASGAVVGGLDEDADRLTRVRGDVSSLRLPGARAVGGRASLVQDGGGPVRPDHLYPQVVVGAAVVEVGEEPRERQRLCPLGQRDRRGLDAGRAAVEVVGPGVGSGWGTGHQRVAPTRGGDLEARPAVAG